MTDKEYLLKKIYQDNTVCYSINLKRIDVNDKINKIKVVEWYLITNRFYVCYTTIWDFYVKKYKNNVVKISVVLNTILNKYFKTNRIHTHFIDMNRFLSVNFDDLP